MNVTPALATALLAALVSCTYVPHSGTPSRTVTVLGRGWTVSRLPDASPTYRAEPDQTALDPFGGGPTLRTTQAVRALETATGCRVHMPSMVLTISGAAQARMLCPDAAPDGATPATPN